jgi:hypothetical protein
VHAAPDETLHVWPHAPQLLVSVLVAVHVPPQHIPIPPGGMQLAPSGPLPLSTHTGVPVEQSIVPMWHKFAGVHEAPWVH